MSSSQADSGEPRLKLSTDKECSRRNTNDNLDKWNWKSNAGKCWDIGKRIHPSCPQPTSWISWLERTSRCATGSRKSVPTIFSSIPVMSQHPTFFGCCFLSAGWSGTAPTLPRVTIRHQLLWQLLSQVQCVNLRNSQKSPEKGNNWPRPIIGQTRPNFFENGPITFQHTLTSQAF